MSLLVATRRAMLIGGGYREKVLATRPITYWMQAESSGSVSIDEVNSPAQDGAYTGVTLGQPGIGDGRTSPLYDGANDFNNVFSASLQGAFNVSEGTFMCQIKVSGAGIWTDGSRHYAGLFGADGAANAAYIRKSTANNTIDFVYAANGTVEIVSPAGITTTDFLNAAITWSVAADEVRAYIDGAQVGVTQNGLGVWVGALNAVRAVFGSTAGSGAFTPWDGNLAHGAVWDRPLSPAEVAGLVVV